MKENKIDVDVNIDHETLDEMMKCIMAIPIIPTDVRNKKFQGECPCGGTITAWRVEPNGHLRASCDKCGFQVIE